MARLDARALRDARITVADLDGDGAIEAVVLSDVTARHPRAAPAVALMDAPGATSISVIRVRPLGLELRARFTAPRRRNSRISSRCWHRSREARVRWSSPP